MLERFYPDVYISSTYKIDFDEYYRQGYRGIIFDIDNTLVIHGAPADKRSAELIEKLHNMGFQILFLSNNKEPRVKMFSDAVKGKYIFKAGKPGKKGYLQAMEMLGTDKRTTLFVGDQLFTDVWGARNTGIFSILVQPIDKKEEIQIVLKRYLEKAVLTFYRLKCRKEGKKYLEEGTDGD
ncbi:YqeG family HAD IIIA-type phosphatase [Parablautia intestinalis]|jgi:HAD superfamily phosphatase (TIGR01668 family)|uniref:YqeG family HAD IIIA-type phosphatase n=1 Tax=Parablautia intestinalis TaxID=2320100 RepID=A0A3A9AGH4_9FIRM|nr:YqeG family HAD IIIA-type phosphatase [Parablautia intestinalis]MCI8615096.1 YqeG family HAD IIIA-type phosphatase [Lachnospiraceae bacterium]MDE7048145.1 YqeG family HAD IIIA-type phosphatase [Lachnospiraceae bacterium]RKI90174.1 YqeG family HAD IIIA-type phosphatase [Parablautia intestinalis]